MNHLGSRTLAARWRAWRLVGLGAMGGIGLSVGVFALAAPSQVVLPWRQAAFFAEAYELVRRSYIEPRGDEELMTAAVRGMVSGLDPYSAYLDATEYNAMRMNTSGEYTGIGVEIERVNGALGVRAVMKDGPAARVGMLAGDVIVGVDELVVTTDNVDQAVERMRGKPGSKFTLTVRRPQQSDLLVFELVRRKVHVASVHWQRLEPNVAYVRIAQFSETTADELTRVLHEAASESPLRGVLLDLRSNPGGVLEAAVDVADVFLNDGVIVSIEGRTPQANVTMRASEGDRLHGAPIVIMTNGGSASGAEIVAGALKDHRRAWLVGQTTYGKGSVQSVTPLAQGGALKLTTARYRTPSGTIIHGVGIAPDQPLGNLSDVAPAAQGAAEVLATDTEARAAFAILKQRIAG